MQIASWEVSPGLWNSTKLADDIRYCSLCFACRGIDVIVACSFDLLWSTAEYEEEAAAAAARAAAEEAEMAEW